MEKFKQVICGSNHNFLIDLQSNYFAFGSNLYGQLCLTHRTPESAPVEIQLKRIQKIFAGYQNTFIIDKKKKYSLCDRKKLLRTIRDWK